MSVHVSGPPQGRTRWMTTYAKELLPSCTDMVHCGELLSCSGDALSGHGTFNTKDGLSASVSGMKVQYSRLYQVDAYKSKYFPKVGDVVVGRIVSVQKARWKVDVNYRMCAVLHLNNVNLPGGELRRKSLEDEIAMSEHLQRGDMVSAAVQQLRMRAQVLLHTRNLKYGKLGQGIVVQVIPSLVKRQKEYMHEMLGVGVVMGCNGIIWISSILISETNGGYSEDIYSILPVDKRLRMVRLATCIRMLAKNLICIYDVSVLSAFSVSLDYEMKDLANPDIVAILIPRIIEMIIAEEKRRTAVRNQKENSRKRRLQ